MNKGKVTIEEFILLLAEAKHSHFVRDEPLPEMLPSQTSKVETCLDSPFQTFDHKPLYKTFDKKAAILFYLLIKNHPLSNGNKRITLCYFFLKAHNRMLDIPDTVLHWLALYTANSRDKAVGVIESVIKHYKS